MVAKPVYLTAEGKAKLEEELHYLLTTRRDEVAEAIRSAKEEGDLSENSAYDEAKGAQAFLEGRIQTIEAQLREAIVVKESNDSSTVSWGHSVTVVEEGTNDPETYKIVGSAEADALNGYISNESPMGKALMGRKKGDVVTVKTPSGDIKFKIKKIQ